MSFNDLGKLHAKALSELISEDHNVLAQLQELDLHFAQQGQNEGEEDEEQASLMWMVWVLAQLQQWRLRSLKLRLRRLLWVPPIVQLTHLSVTFTCAVCCSMQWLSLLTNLETVLLHMGDPLSAPRGLQVMDLRKCTQLRSACFRDVHCAEVHVPRQCAIHLELSRADLTAGCDWSGALASVQSLCWGLKGHAPKQLHLPVAMVQACNLRWLDLHCEQVGAAGAPLNVGAALSSVVKLRIRCSALHLRLPDKSALEELVIHAEDMNVRCGDVLAFTEQLRAFHIVCTSATGDFLVHMRTAMVVRGKRITSEECPIRLPWAQVKHIMYSSGECEFGCPCGCCSECLFRAGLMPSD